MQAGKVLGTQQQRKAINNSQLERLRQDTVRHLHNFSDDSRALAIQARLVNCRTGRRCGHRACPRCESTRNFRTFQNVSNQLLNVPDDVVFVQATWTTIDVAVQALRKSLDELASQVQRYIDRRRECIAGVFASFEASPTPDCDLLHPHVHMIFAVHAGALDSPRLGSLRDSADFKILSPEHAGKWVYYSTKSGVSKFADRWTAQLDAGFLDRADQMDHFRRHRCYGCLRDRQLPLDEQKSLDELASMAEQEAEAGEKTEPGPEPSITLAPGEWVDTNGVHHRPGDPWYRTPEQVEEQVAAAAEAEERRKQRRHFAELRQALNPEWRPRPRSKKNDKKHTLWRKY